MGRVRKKAYFCRCLKEFLGSLLKIFIAYKCAKRCNLLKINILCRFHFLFRVAGRIPGKMVIVYESWIC